MQMRHLLFALVSILILNPLVLIAQIAGHTAGQFQVNESGAAIYTIPISVAPGTAGVEPKLSLTYSSQGRNGLLGVGWTLSGLSVISRCPATLAQDGFVDGVDFDSHDRFCLDGERLMAIGGFYGDNATEYRTEQNTFRKVISYGHAGSGPSSFTIKTKSGLTIQYGGTIDSLIEAHGRADAIFWPVNKITDTAGNSLSVTYAEREGEYRPERIDYTANEAAGLEPYASVGFVYEDRTDSPRRYVSGSWLRTTKRLKTIQAFEGEQLYREYRLAYEAVQGAGPSKLTSITECGSDGACFAPTTFTWKPVGLETFDSPLPVAGLTKGYWADRNNSTQMPADFNGDGITDLVNLQSDGTSNNWIALGKTDGTFDYRLPVPGLTKGYWGNFNNSSQLPGDFNGDGFTDLVNLQSDGTTNNWISFSNGDGTFDFRLPVPGLTKGYWGNVNNSRQLTGDFNGDGLTDIANLQSDGTTNNWVAFSNGDGTFDFRLPVPGLTKGYWGSVNNSSQLTGDFNGDGLTDIVNLQSDGTSNNWLALSNGDGTFDFRLPVSGLTKGYWGSVHNSTQLTGDFNGDGLTDIVNLQSDGVTNNWLALSRGDGTFDYRLPVEGLTKGYWDNANNASQLAADINGDGFTDIVNLQSDGTSNNWIAFSNGDGTFRFVLPVPGITRGYWGDGNHSIQFAGDFDGDGLVDLTNLQSDGTTNNWVAVNRHEVHTLLASIITGHGKRTFINYAPLTDPAVYTKGNDAEYPRRDFQGPMQVVSSYEVSNSIGSMNSFSYHYAGAKINLRGRGFRGFDRTTVTAHRTGITNTVFYERDYRCISSKIRRTEQRQPDGTLISETDNEIDIQDHGNGVYFSYVSESRARNYELDGSLVSDVTTRTDYDYNGNVTSLIVDYGDGFTEATVNTYEDDTDNWFLGRLTRAEVTKTAPGQPDQARVSAFAYDPATGLLTKEIIEPDNPVFRLEKSYTHDQFGNIHNSTTSGLGIAARTHTTWYDNQGRYVTRSMNAVGHIEDKTYLLGNLVTLTGPNGLTTSWSYDGFGRQLQELRADGTSTLMSYKPCGELCPENATYYAETVSTGAPVARIYFNKLDLEVRKEVEGFDGTPIFVDTQYNVRGLVARVSDPYFMGYVPLWTIYHFDLLGRPTTETAPFDRITTTEYLGRTTIVTNALGQTSTRKVDVRGQLVTSTDNLGGSINYSYDAFGNLVEMRDPAGNITALTYDIRGNRLSITDPDTGTTLFAYNTLGELTSQTDAKGQTVTLTYDLLGRMISRAEPEGISSWTYDTAYKGVGKISSVSRGDYTEVFFYDDLGRPAETQTRIGVETYSLTTLYDLFGRPDTLIYPTGFGVRTYYTASGHLSEVRRMIGNGLIWKANEVNARGQLERVTLGNGLSTDTTYHFYTGQINTVQTGNVQHLGVQFDLLGNLVGRSDLLRQIHEDLIYDGLNRLTSSRASRLIGGEVVASEPITLAYDQLGNIIYKSDVGSYNYGENGAGPHAVTSIAGVRPNSYSYDANGNRIASQEGSVSYTSFNKPRTITSGNNLVSFSYGPDYGRYRQIRDDGTTTTTRLYVGGVFERERYGEITKDVHYIRAGGRAVAVYTVEDNCTESTHEYTRYLHHDHLGSVQAITGEQGNLVEALAFDPWGNRRDPETWSPVTEPIIPTLDRGFTFHEHLDAVGLIHMNGRVYDPVVGRFLSADPFVQAPQFSQSLNRYSYVLNNPLSLTDPSGFFSFGKALGNLFRGAGRAIRGTISFIEDNGYQIVQAAALAAPSPYTFAAVVAASAVVSVHAGVQSGAGFGDILGSTVISVAVTAASAVATSYIGGSKFLPEASSFARQGAQIIAHGVVQGTARVALGGKFEHGFLAGAFGKAGSLASASLAESLGFSPNLGAAIGGIIAGGTAEELGGGKFANGAASAAFVYAFNYLAPAIPSFGLALEYLAAGVSAITKVLTVTSLITLTGDAPDYRSLFRVVDQAELASIEATQQFQLEPGQAEVKRFLITITDARHIRASGAVPGKIDSLRIVEAVISQKIFSKLHLSLSHDRVTVVTAYGELLPQLNRDVRNNGGIRIIE